MKNLEIKHVVKIRVWFTASEWELYDTLEARVVAYGLNATLEDYVNRGEKKDVVRRFMLSAMNGHSDAGANDTEPRAFLERVLTEIYGE
jgi:hypothetical protein